MAADVETACGKVNLKAAPFGDRCDPQKLPPWASTIDRQIQSPMPIPFGLVLKNGSKIRLAMDGSSPGPVSARAAAARQCQIPSARRGRSPGPPEYLLA